MTRTQTAWTALAVVAIAVSACLGTQARDNIRSAAMSLDTAEQHLALGLAAGVASDELSLDAAGLLQAQFSTVRDAVEHGRRELLFGVPLDGLRQWADRGVDERLLAGELGPAAANSKRNRLRLFFDLLDRMGRP